MTREDWQSYQKHVLAELKRCSDLHELTDAKITDLTITVAKLDQKAGIWGSLAGVGTILLYALVDKYLFA